MLNYYFSTEQTVIRRHNEWNSTSNIWKQLVDAHPGDVYYPFKIAIVILSCQSRHWIVFYINKSWMNFSTLTFKNFQLNFYFTTVKCLLNQPSFKAQTKPARQLVTPERWCWCLYAIEMPQEMKRVVVWMCLKITKLQNGLNDVPS